MYRAINAAVKKDGMEAYAGVQQKSFLEEATTKVDAVQIGSRLVESIRSIMKHKTGVISDMFTRGKASKSRIDAGETVGNDERCPGEAISVPTNTEDQT